MTKQELCNKMLEILYGTGYYDNLCELRYDEKKEVVIPIYTLDNGKKFQGTKIDVACDSLKAMAKDILNHI